MTTISIVGAHGTGKTTLCNAIKNIYSKHDTIVISDIARSCPDELGLKSNSKIQRRLLKKQIQIESLFSSKRNVITIFDNSSIGHLAYYTYFEGNDTELKEQAIKLSLKKSTIILLPLNDIFLIDDGLRPIDRNFYADIQSLIIKILEQNKIPHIKFPDTWHKVYSKRISELFNYEEKFIDNSSKKLIPIVSVGIVKNSKNEILTTLRSSKNIPEADLCWDLPGGGVEYGEDPSFTVEREIFEETGYVVKSIMPIPSIQSNQWNHINGDIIHVIVLCYLCKLIDGKKYDVKNSDDDIIDISWKRIEEFDNLVLLKGIDNFLREYNEFVQKYKL